MLSVVILSDFMMCGILLSIRMLNVVAQNSSILHLSMLSAKLSAIMLSVTIPSGIFLSVIIQCNLMLIVILSVILLSVIMLNVNTMSAIILSVDMLSVIKLGVVAPKLSF